MDEKYVFFESRDFSEGRIDTRVQNFIENEMRVIWREYHYLLNCIQQCDMPYVFISNKIKRKIYGKYNTAYISDAFEKIMEDADLEKMGHRILDKAHIILSKLDDIIMNEGAKLDSATDRIIIMDEVNDLEKQLLEEATEEEINLLKEIKDLFSNWKYSDLILGEYYPDRHQILIYIDAIHRIARKANVDLQDEIRLTLAHELFHAIHHENAPKNAVWKAGKASCGIGAYEKNVIKESLADYISVYWCCRQNNAIDKVSDKRIKLWASRYYSKWPYAKAICYLKKCTSSNYSLPLVTDVNDIEKGLCEALDVYNKSLNNEKEAYEMIQRS